MSIFGKSKTWDLVKTFIPVGAPRLTLTTKGFLLVAIPLAVQLIFVCSLFYLVRQVQAQADRAQRGEKIVFTSAIILKRFYDAGFAVTLGARMHDETAKGRYEQIRQSINQQLDNLSILVQGDARQENSYGQIEALSMKVLQLLDQTKLELETGQSGMALLSSIGAEQEQAALLSQLDRALNELIHTEQDYQKEHPLSRYSGLLSSYLLASACASILIFVSAAIWINKRAVKRLLSVLENAKKLAQDKPLNAPISGQDEIAELDAAFHTMVADLAAARRRERAMLANVGDVICTVEPDQSFGDVNPAATRLWSYRKDQLVGRKVHEVVAEPDRENTTRLFQQAISSGDEIKIENQIVRADGSRADMLWSVTWSPDEESLFCVVHDFSERKEADRFKQQLLAMVSHDIRSPLTAICASVELVLTGDFGHLNEKGLSILNNAEKSANQLISLVNDLLDIEKLQAGKLILSAKSQPVMPLFRRAVGSVRRLAENKNIELKISDHDVMLYVDGNRILQVLVNLLANAIKFSPPGSEVQLQATGLDNRAEISVIDQGRGVPDELRHKIFERFLQVETGDSQHGSGLGLAICRSIVDAHGGEIGVDACRDRGSRFWFTVPVHEPQPVAANDEETGGSAVHPDKS